MHEQQNICIRDFKSFDLAAVKSLIDKTIDISYTAFYNDEAIMFFKHHHCDENISKDAKQGHTVVLEESGQIIGTGTILDNEIKRVFIDPAFQKHASLAAKKFYDSLGYLTLERTFLEVTNGKKLDYYKMEKLLNK